MNPSHFLDVAATLIESGAAKPKQAYLRRANSTIYYALFHTASRNCADLLIGAPGQHTSKHAWLEAYRFIDHGAAYKKCKSSDVIQKFKPAIQDFATQFVKMQDVRHEADYDPTRKFHKSESISNLETTTLAIVNFESEAKKDKRAFCFYLKSKRR